MLSCLWQTSGVVVEVVLKKGQVWADPTDATKRAHINGWTERRWRHLDTCQFETLIKARVCRNSNTPMARSKNWLFLGQRRCSRVTTLMSGFVIKLLQTCPTTQSVCNLTRLSGARSMPSPGARRGAGHAQTHRRRNLHLGIDEKSSQKGHSYVTI